MVTEVRYGGVATFLKNLPTFSFLKEAKAKMQMYAEMTSGVIFKIAKFSWGLGLLIFL